MFPKSRGLLVFNFLVAFLLPLLDLVSVAAFFPILSNLLSSGKESIGNQFLQYADFIGLANLSTQIWLIAFITFTVFSSLFRLLSIYAQEKFILSYSAQLSENIMNNILHQTSYFLSKQPLGDWSSLVLVKTQDVMRSSINNIILLIATSSFFCVGLLTIFLTSSWTILISVVPIITIYISLVVISRSFSNDLGKTVNSFTSILFENLNETFNLKTQVIIDKKQKYFIERFNASLSTLNDAFIKVSLLRDAPKHVIETILILMVCFALLFFINLNFNTVLFFPIVGTLCLAAYRFLPFVNQIYRSINGIIVSKEMLCEVQGHLSIKPVIGSNVTSRNQADLARLNTSIEIKGLDKKIGLQNEILFQDAEIYIKKGETVYLSGGTGSGKSTLLNILSGSTYPDDRNLLIDGKKLDVESQSVWFDQVAYVQQQIYFENNTIINNILFGDEASDENIQKCLELIEVCNLTEVFENNFGTDEFIGENGRYLSGGQRQRLAICRALYKNPELLLLDEATSGLDSVTEKLIFNNINKNYPDLTIVIVSHNQKLSEFADKIFLIEDRKIKQITENKS